MLLCIVFSVGTSLERWVMTLFIVLGQPPVKTPVYRRLPSLPFVALRAATAERVHLTCTLNEQTLLATDRYCM